MTMENDLVERLTRERDEARALALTSEISDDTEAWKSSQSQLHRLVDTYGVSMFDACYLGQLIARYGATKASAATFHIQALEAELARKTEALRAYYDAYEGVYDSITNDGKKYRSAEAIAAEDAARSALEEKTDV